MLTSRAARSLAAYSILALPFLFAACGGATSDADYADAMAAEHAGETPSATPAGVGDGFEVAGGTVAYHEVDGQPIDGLLVRPVISPGATVDRGVVLVHEWWGLNANMEGAARRLAAEGFVVLAVDIYNGQTGETPEEARSLMQAAMAAPEAIVANTRAASEWLRSNGGVSRVAVMGYCFGGGVALRTAMAAPDAVDAAVIYYGHVNADVDALRTIDDPLLGLFGAEDSGIPLDDVRAFEAAAAEADVSLDLHVFAGAEHAFANPSGQRYDAAAADAAWALTIAFLNEHL